MFFRKMTAVALAALLLASLAGCGRDEGGGDAASEPVALIDSSEMFSGRDIESGFDESECTLITLSGDSVSVSGEGAKASGGTVTVSAAGDYLLTGTLKDGTIIVDADKSDKVRLILRNVNVSSSSGAAVNVRKADKVIITLARGSENFLSSAVDTDSDGSVDAAVYSKDDLTVNGEGSLTVSAASGHGIVSKDDLVISGGVYTITSGKKAIDANDSIRIAGGSFDIHSGTDALHTGNDEEGKGFIYIADGTFSVTAGTDAMDASGVIQIDNGTFSLVTGGGSSNASTGGKKGGWGRWGGKNSKEASSSAKGLKSDSAVVINGGAVNIDSSDDAIHSDAQVIVTGGTVSISSGDDGIHAGSALSISGGTVTVSRSYEGLEGMSIDISGGIVSVTASDDGMNAAGGSDQSSVSGRPGQNKFAAQEGVCISISGGSVMVNALGDGIDSNGDVEVSGGEVYVSGAADNGNAALDYNGSATVTGGTFIAAGMSGMAQNFGSGSTQGAMLVKVGSQPAGSEIRLMNDKGETLASFLPEKAYDCVVISTPDVGEGGVYTLRTGASSTVVKMDSLLYGEGGMNGGPGGMRGGRRGG